MDCCHVTRLLFSVSLALAVEGNRGPVDVHLKVENPRATNGCLDKMSQKSVSTQDGKTLGSRLQGEDPREFTQLGKLRGQSVNSNVGIINIDSVIHGREGLAGSPGDADDCGSGIARSGPRHPKTPSETDPESYVGSRFPQLLRILHLCEASRVYLRPSRVHSSVSRRFLSAVQEFVVRLYKYQRNSHLSSFRLCFTETGTRTAVYNNVFNRGGRDGAPRRMVMRARDVASP